MKINEYDLKKGFKEFSKENTPLSRKKCPSINTIVKLCRSEISDKKREKILNHILNCYYCFSDIEIISKVINFEAEFCKIARQIYPTQERKIDKLKRCSAAFFYKAKWKYQVACLILLTIILVFSPFFLFRREKMTLRGFQNTQIEVILPAKTNQRLSTVDLFWHSYPKVEYYIVEIFNENLSLFWKSKKLFINTLIPPQELIKNLSTKKKYYLMVTAFFINGKKIESKLTEFSVVRVY
jgi:hypothetical protein